ncbi:MAG: hypothetical protein A2X28_06485 [Elusimicrobia bacterium GWA2_56_46]|nr:MAG: hypothetical protein A2X28_06485 [Elusimicrobia bacterium GWA2_56_46]OGR54901.1 MAG: hypothetical protein A2X39_11505 [Elusimicrobia bacterium GWC2_56_31]
MSMRKLRLLFLLAAIAVFRAPVAYAADTWVAPRTVYYLTRQQQQFPELKVPPAVGSKEALADLAAVRDWQQKRTEEQCAKARSEAHAEYDEFFGDISPFPRPLPDGAAAIFKRLKAETDWINVKVKDRFKRPRPFESAPDLKHCLDRIGGPSYPSGHATVARIYALVLSHLVPVRRSEFLARADEAALNRVISGVHYPSDIEGGKKLADAVYARFLKRRTFQADMKSLKGYLSVTALPAAK